MKFPTSWLVLAAFTLPLAAQTPSATSAAEVAKPAGPLPAETRAAIARMTPIFDGQTLEGWIQAPPAPLNFGSNDIADVVALAKKLTGKPDAVSTWLSGQLDEPAVKALADWGATAPATAADLKALNSALIKNLNRLVAGASLFEAERFRGVQLRSSTKAMERAKPSMQAVARYNRMLLEDAYPQELVVSPAASWIVKDGAMASTGAGRGVIYTREDYGHYRLIFTMRHVGVTPGQGEHQPCILVFCTRPVPGEKGLDALGGIQFQAPNGGHWDYRPGHNNAGTAFTNPIKPKYDNHDWFQVELLVNAADGTARMAVAIKPGTRAIEVLDFKDPAAAKVGPIAWQMHNAGLFDEFKDVVIEIDPQEDRLITLE